MPQHIKNRIVQILTVFIILSLGACSTATKNFQPGIIPAPMQISESKTSETRALLDKYAQQNDLELRQSGAEYHRVNAMVTKLARAAGLKGDSFPVYIADAGDIKNAFAINSNTIVVYTALLDELSDDNQLSVVLAHEVAHILGQHSEDDTEKSRGAAVAIGSILLGTAVSIATGVDVVGDTVANTANTLGAGAFVLSYGRAQEYEADHIGMLLMAKAGYDPNNAISVWQNANTILGAGAKNSFLSSHPAHGDRKKRLEQTLPYALPLFEDSQK